ncbi:MAG: phosphatase PAP2 family protein [Clostridia bacterium]|nr:phosphatase PAP2 family protein [Clostridia bacterium]
METGIINFIQSISSGFSDVFFAGCTLLSEETLLIVLIAFLYWCCDKRIGECMLLSLYAANAVNAVLKDIIQRDRPFIDETVKDKIRYVELNGLVNTVDLKYSYSFPSGHSANIAVIMTSLCCSVKKVYGKVPLWLKIITPLLIMLVMISRVYLGVHFPTDVLVGAFIGIISAAVIVALFFKFYDRRLTLFIIVFLVSLSALFFDPTADTYKMLGVGFGGIAGMIIERKFIDFSTDVSKGKKALRVIYGAAFLSVLRLILKLALPSLNVFGFLRYAVIGFCAIAVCPFAFKKFNI